MTSTLGLTHVAAEIERLSEDQVDVIIHERRRMTTWTEVARRSSCSVQAAKKVWASHLGQEQTITAIRRAEQIDRIEGDIRSARINKQLLDDLLEIGLEDSLQQAKSVQAAIALQDQINDLENLYAKVAGTFAPKRIIASATETADIMEQLIGDQSVQRVLDEQTHRIPLAEEISDGREILQPDSSWPEVTTQESQIPSGTASGDDWGW